MKLKYYERLSKKKKNGEDKECGPHGATCGMRLHEHIDIQVQ